MPDSIYVLEINATCANEKQPVNYGVRDALGPFPLHQLVNTMTATINNNTVSMNTKDILPAMRRMLENRELAKYNNSTPVAYDTNLKYSDIAGKIIIHLMVIVWLALITIFNHVVLLL